MQTIDDFPIIMTAKDVAKFLQVSPPTAYEIMRRNDFPVIALSGVSRGNVRVLRDDLITWLKGRKETA